MGNLSISVSAYERTRDNYISIIQGQASKTKDALKTLIENGYDEKMGICIEGEEFKIMKYFGENYQKPPLKPLLQYYLILRQRITKES